MNKRIVLTLVFLMVGFAIGFRLFCGIFVVQPIGANPDGVTIVYWRDGLNIPFVASADGMIKDAGIGVSLFARGLMLAKIAGVIKGREIARLGYSETLYLWSTDGNKYEK